MSKKIIVILSLLFVFFPTFVFAQLDSGISDDGGCYPLLTSGSGQDNFSKLVKKLSKKERKKQEKEQADREQKAITYNQLSSDYQNLKTRSSQLIRQTPLDICDLSKNQQSWMVFWSQQGGFLNFKNLLNEAVFNYGEWLTFYKKTLFLAVSGDDTISNSCNLDLVFAINYLKLPGFEMADLQRLQKIADELKASKMVLNRMQKDQTELEEEKRLLLERMMRRGK